MMRMRRRVIIILMNNSNVEDQDVVNGDGGDGYNHQNNRNVSTKVEKPLFGNKSCLFRPNIFRTTPSAKALQNHHHHHPLTLNFHSRVRTDDAQLRSGNAGVRACLSDVGQHKHVLAWSIWDGDTNLIVHGKKYWKVKTHQWAQHRRELGLSLLDATWQKASDFPPPHKWCWGCLHFSPVLVSTVSTVSAISTGSTVSTATSSVIISVIAQIFINVITRNGKMSISDCIIIITIIASSWSSLPRLEICRDRWDRRSCKNFPNCVKFGGNNAN